MNVRDLATRATRALASMTLLGLVLVRKLEGACEEAGSIELYLADVYKIVYMFAGYE